MTFLTLTSSCFRISFLQEKLKTVAVGNILWYTVQEISKYTVILASFPGPAQPSIACSTEKRYVKHCMSEEGPTGPKRCTCHIVVGMRLCALRLFACKYSRLTRPYIIFGWEISCSRDQCTCCLRGGEGGPIQLLQPGDTFQECHDILMWPFICTIVCYMYKNA